eukprot:m.188108 g.188108  ORF g.188108 m.188108 type:complete len:60 (-) comp17533_c0_seq4:37-216(-)
MQMPHSSTRADAAAAAMAEVGVGGVRPASVTHAAFLPYSLLLLLMVVIATVAAQMVVKS